MNPFYTLGRHYCFSQIGIYQDQLAIEKPTDQDPHVFHSANICNRASVLGVILVTGVIYL